MVVEIDTATYDEELTKAFTQDTLVGINFKDSKVDKKHEYLLKYLSSNQRF